MNVHTTAMISDGAEIAQDVEIGPYVTIGPKVRIGRGTRIKSHAVIEGNTTIGENNEVGYFCVLGGPPQDLKYKGEDTKLVIGDNNRFREYITINTGTAQDEGITSVGNNCLLMAYVHLGHDCRLGDNVIIANSTNLAGHVEVEDYVSITGGVGISPFVRLGKHAYVAGHSAVDKGVAPYTIVMGNRAKARGINLIGLKRRGYSADQIRAITDAYKIYFESGKEKALAISEIEELYPDQVDVRYFIDFIKNSRSGVA